MHGTMNIKYSNNIIDNTARKGYTAYKFVNALEGTAYHKTEKCKIACLAYTLLRKKWKALQCSLERKTK
jgi:predicted fused transcriptional regulator/phosphomethylpyrimidine kinase